MPRSVTHAGRQGVLRVMRSLRLIFSVSSEFSRAHRVESQHLRHKVLIRSTHTQFCKPRGSDSISLLGLGKTPRSPCGDTSTATQTDTPCLNHTGSPSLSKDFPLPTARGVALMFLKSARCAAAVEEKPPSCFRPAGLSPAQPPTSQTPPRSKQIGNHGSSRKPFPSLAQPQV